MSAVLPIFMRRPAWTSGKCHEIVFDKKTWYLFIGDKMIIRENGEDIAEFKIINDLEVGNANNTDRRKAY